MIYSIADEVFIQFPGYVRGVVLAYDVKNSKSSADLVTLLRDAEASVRGRLNKDEIAQHPRIASWREAYRSFGAKPGKFRSSIEAMVRRVLGGNELPSINALVDIGNILSLQNLVPMGGHAIDVVKQDLNLRPAAGKEEFVPFGSKQIEHPDPGEIIFVEKFGSKGLDRSCPTHFFFNIDQFGQFWSVCVMIHNFSPYRELL